MANEIVAKEIKKILSEDRAESEKVALACSWIVANFKGVNIKAINVSESSSLCDFNIIATATNITQAKTMVNEIAVNLRDNGHEIISLEGLTDADWILLDAGDVIVHILQEQARDVYDLDSLWGAFPQLEIPADYYFGQVEIDVKIPDSTENYF
jgi:ribosome-associated protein